VAKIAVVREKPKSIVYGPLRHMPVEPSDPAAAEWQAADAAA
jgi:hypothetical protein